MRCNVFFVAATLLLAASLPATAQINVDMNQMTCRDWLGYGRENQDFVRFWMSGYYNAAANNKVMSYDLLQRNSAKVVAYCKKHKSDPLPKAINKLRG
jgi:acid stress chaperone HdeB